MMSREIFFWTLVAMCWIHVYSENEPTTTSSSTTTEPDQVSSGNESTTTSSSTTAAPDQVSSQDLPDETTTTTSPANTQYGVKEVCDAQSLDDKIKITDNENVPVIIAFLKYTSPERVLWSGFLEEVYKHYKGLKIFKAFEYEQGGENTTFKDISPPLIIFRKDQYDIRYYDELHHETVQAILYIWFNEFHEYDGFTWPHPTERREIDKVCYETTVTKSRETADDTTTTTSSTTTEETTTTTSSTTAEETTATTSSTTTEETTPTTSSTTTEQTTPTPSPKETQYSFEIIDDKQTLENKIKTADDDKVPVIVVFFKPDSLDKAKWELLFPKVIKNHKGLQIFEALVNGENGIDTTFNISSCPAIIFRKDGHENRFNDFIFNHVQAMLYIWFTKVCYYEGYSKTKGGSSIDGRTDDGSSIGYQTDDEKSVNSAYYPKEKKGQLQKLKVAVNNTIRKWTSFLQPSATSDASNQTRTYSTKSRNSEYANAHRPRTQELQETPVPSEADSKQPTPHAQDNHSGVTTEPSEADSKQPAPNAQDNHSGVVNPSSTPEPSEADSKQPTPNAQDNPSGVVNPPSGQNDDEGKSASATADKGSP